MQHPIGWIKRRARRLMAFYGLTDRRLAVVEAAIDFKHLRGARRAHLKLIPGGRTC
jgi:hypothetical protein